MPARAGGQIRGEHVNLESPWEVGVGTIKGLEFDPKTALFFFFFRPVTMSIFDSLVPSVDLAHSRCSINAD